MQSTASGEQRAPEQQVARRVCTCLQLRIIIDLISCAIDRCTVPFTLT